jgi:hypothetical protein
MVRRIASVPRWRSREVEGWVDGYPAYHGRQVPGADRHGTLTEASAPEPDAFHMVSNEFRYDVTPIGDVVDTGDLPINRSLRNVGTKRVGHHPAHGHFPAAPSYSSCYRYRGNHTASDINGSTR